MGKRTAGAVCKAAAFGAAALLLLFSALPLYALADGFQSDLDGIDRALQSVLKLYVFDADGNMLSTGSGFVAFDSYTLVTNAHVLKNPDMAGEADHITAVSDAGVSYPVTKVIAGDAQKDIALLEFFAPTDVAPLELGTGQGLKRAAPVVAIGSPEGILNTVSLGNISALYEDGGVPYIQFTASISHGSSGGALFDNGGKVIGVTSGSLEAGQNMNLAINIGVVTAMHGAYGSGPRQGLAAFLQAGGLGGQASSSLEIAAPTAPPATQAPLATVPVLNLGAGDSRVLDYAGLFSKSDETALESRIAGMAAGSGMDAVVAAFPGTGEDIQGFAERFYRDNGFSESGLLFLIDSGAGAYCVYTFGDVSEALGDSGTEALTGAAMPDFQNGLFAKAALAVLDKAEAQLRAAGVLTAQAAPTQTPAPTAKPAARPTARITSMPFMPDYTFPPGFLPVNTAVPTGTPAPTARPSAAPTDTPTASPARTAEPGGRGEAFVQVGLTGMWEKKGGGWLVNPTVVNGSKTETVKGFTVAYLCGDEAGQAAYSSLTGGMYVTFTYAKTLGPGGAVFPGGAYLAGYGDIAYVYAAVTGYTLKSGETVDYPREDWVFGAMRVKEEER